MGRRQVLQEREVSYQAVLCLTSRSSEDACPASAPSRQLLKPLHNHRDRAAPAIVSQMRIQGGPKQADTPCA